MLGRRGEKLAARVLRELGLDILARNYRTTRGEIDIVAREGTTLCFVEVKTRHRSLRSRPADAVGTAKRQRIIRAAKQYLREIGRPRIVYRYDIVEVIVRGRRVEDMRYWRSAFSEEKGRGGLTFPGGPHLEGWDLLE
ncbi:MAG: YraN family protein [Lentisphaeria bacterium]|nr:YraN family protein [Lentisphaeria bacterium]